MSISFLKVNEEIQLLEKEGDALKKDINSKYKRLQEIQDYLYQARQKSIHIAEIYRIAEIQFPRLRKQVGQGLTGQDIQELEKLIDRAKSPDGLKNIVDALVELNKYYPQDIKSNLYGLLQRIIIGGAYGTGKKRK
jgi:chaperonin cofactor prefoldin